MTMLLHVALEGGWIATVSEAHVLKKSTPNLHLVLTRVAEGAPPMRWQQGELPQPPVE